MDGLFSTCLVVGILYLARDIFVPLALAMLLAFLLEPLARRLELLHLGRTVSAFVAMFAVVIIGCLGTFIVSKQLSQLGTNLPSYEARIHQRIQQVRDGYVGPASKAVKSIQDFRKGLTPTNSPESSLFSTNSSGAVEQKPIPVEIQDNSQPVIKLVQRLFSPSLKFLIKLILVVVFCIFMLIGRHDLRTRLIHIVGPRNVRLTIHFLEETDSRLSRYLLMQLLVNASYGTVVGLALWLIGIPNPLLWGISAAVLRYIPYAGAWIGASLPFAIALAVDSGWSKSLMVLVLFMVLETVTANLVEPWLYGRFTGITSFAVLLAAVFWTWLWGPVGLLLSMPLTVTVASIARYFPELEIIDLLFGESTDPVKKPPPNALAQS